MNIKKNLIALLALGLYFTSNAQLDMSSSTILSGGLYLGPAANTSGLGWGTNYIGFHVARASNNAGFNIASDNTHNGGGLFYSTVFGEMVFTPFATTVSNGGVNQSFTDQQVYNNAMLKITPNNVFAKNLLVFGTISNTSDVPYVIFRTKRSDNSLPSELSTDSKGNFSFSKNITVGGTIIQTSDVPTVVLRSLRSDNTLPSEISTDSKGNFSFSKNITVGGTIIQTSDVPTVVLRSLRSDNTLPSEISTDSKGNFSFSKNITVGGTIIQTSDVPTVVLRSLRSDNTLPSEISTDSKGNFSFSKNITVGGTIIQ